MNREELRKLWKKKYRKLTWKQFKVIWNEATDKEKRDMRKSMNREK